MLRTALYGFFALAPLLVGCAAGLSRPRGSIDETESFDACERPISLDEIARRASEGDVVLVGEMHRHPLGLAVSAALFEKITQKRQRAALSLEFLERDTQAAVDDYLAGRIDRPAFLERSRLRGSDPEPGHLAMIDLAKRLGLPVVASNAPRAYAKKARVEGYAALRALPEPEQALFVVPEVLPSGRYMEEFTRMMGGETHAPPPTAPGEHGHHHGEHHHGDGRPSPHEDRATSFFRAQALWDATMADSIARALIPGQGPVVHVVGRFHVEHHGGLVQLLRREKPEAKVFTVALVETREDVTPGLADAAIVVGPAPAEAR